MTHIGSLGRLLAVVLGFAAAAALIAACGLTGPQAAGAGEGAPPPPPGAANYDSPPLPASSNYSPSDAQQTVIDAYWSSCTAASDIQTCGCTLTWLEARESLPQLVQDLTAYLQSAGSGPPDMSEAFQYCESLPSPTPS